MLDTTFAADRRSPVLEFDGPVPHLKGTIMKTHNAFIYHCLCCGNIVHSEMKVRAPQCCGHEMVKAAAETIYNREEAHSEEPAGVHCEAAAPAVKPR